MLRLFVSANLPADALEACATECRRVERALGRAATGVRFSRPGGLHLTLKFLGPTPESDVLRVHAGLERAAKDLPPFDVVLRGLEAFPDARRPRVVYLSMTEGAMPLKRLAAALEAQLAPLGFPGEKRAFTPHLTLARVKDPKAAPKVGAAIAALEPVDVARVRVEAIWLMLSDLSPGGSRYTGLARVPLAG